MLTRPLRVRWMRALVNPIFTAKQHVPKALNSAANTHRQGLVALF
jgi:hypothetical protein